MSKVRFYTESKLGPNRSLTPEGFLLCTSVPIARVGTLLYGKGEIPIEPGPDGVISITRDPEDVFAQDAIDSFLGKPVTNDHPPNGRKVTPKNWKNLAVGDTLNVRRGDGAVLDSDYLFADLLIKDEAAIKDVLAGKREVSAGYDAEYEQTGQGRGRQRDIIGNHVALVDRGRCGPRCSIGDTDTMAGRTTYADRIRKAFRTRDEGALVEELKKVGDMLGEVVGDADMDPDDSGAAGLAQPGAAQHHVTINVGPGGVKMPSGPSSSSNSVTDDEEEQADPNQQNLAQGDDPAAMMQQLLQRVETLEKAVILLSKEEDDENDGDDDSESGDDTGMGEDASEKPGEVTEEEPVKTTGDRRRASVGDSTSMAAAWQDTISKAEILAPGLIRVPTFDSARPARVTFDTLCNLRRTALAKAWGTEDGRSAISELYTPRPGKKPNFTSDAMTCQETSTLFNGAANARRKMNTYATTDGVRRIVMDHGRETSLGSRKAVTPADINARSREIFKNV